MKDKYYFVPSYSFDEMKLKALQLQSEKWTRNNRRKMLDAVEAQGIEQEDVRENKRLKVIQSQGFETGLEATKGRIAEEIQLKS